MADITKCVQTLCPMKDNCYRHTAPESDWQSWALFDYEITISGPICKHQIPVFQSEVAINTN